MARRIQLRRDTAANWTATNPTLAQGEVGIDLTNNKLKIGNGTAAWNSLAYFDDKETVLSNYAGHIVPSEDNTYDLGAPDKQWRDIFVSEGSIYIGDIKLSNDNGTLKVQRVTDAGLETETPMSDAPGSVTTDRLVNGDLTAILDKRGTINVTSIYPVAFTAVVNSDHYVGEGTLTLEGEPWSFLVEFIVNEDNTIETHITNNTPWPSNPGYTNDMPFEFTEADHGITGYTFGLILTNIQNPGPMMYTTNLTASTPPDLYPMLSSTSPIKLKAGNSDLVLGTNGSVTLPGTLYVNNTTLSGSIVGNDGINITSPNAGQVYMVWQKGLVESPYTEVPPGRLDAINSGISLGWGGVIVEVNRAEDGGYWTFAPDQKLKMPPGGDIVDSDGVSVLGGGSSPIQPYLELTNTPLIIQPAVLGTPVTVTEAPSGINANFMVTITEGPTLDTGSIIVSNGGSGYTVGQRYRLWNYNVGGPDVASSIDFEVETVGEDGAILTIINAAFVGSASNVPGTYEFVSAELRASVFDEIDTGLTLTRDGVQGIYNVDLESEYDNNTYLSPLGTEWNADGWGNLLELGTRSYTTWRQALNNSVGNNIVPAELVMHDTANDRYYKFDFTVWGGNNGGYSYTRTEVTDPNYFRKPHNAELADIIVADDPEGTGIAIARTDGAGIFNLYQEQSFAAESPVGTLWNADGWDDLSNIETRTYSVFDLAANGYNNVLGKKFVMYVASTQKYYAIEFLEWDTTGNNNFAYVRKEIDLTKVNEGIRFADGTTLKSAEGIGRVKLTSPNNRRIEEVHGYNQVSVSEVITTNLSTVASRFGSTTFDIWVDNTTTTIDDIIDNPQNYGNAYGFEFSVDNNTWYPYNGHSDDGNERTYIIYPNLVTYNQGDTIYFRYKTGGDPVVWWNKADLPSGGTDFRGAVIDYHAYTGESTIVGSIHIVDDSGEEHISHQEVASGSTDGENDDLWLVQNEGTISYRRIDGEQKTLKVQWTAKVFYGSEFWD